MGTASKGLALSTALLFTNTVYAEPTPVTGDASFYDSSGFPIISSIPITGELDIANGSATFSSFLFFGFQFETLSAELLGEGTHTRCAVPETETVCPQDMSVTVGAGQLGAYILFNWSNNTLPTFMVWDLNSHPTGTSYTVIDSDADSVPGHAYTAGPFTGVTVTYDLLEGEPPPDVDVSINIEGGSIQECSEAGGSTVNLEADITLIGGAELGSVDWTIDGEPAGSGTSLSPFMALGTHEIEVSATILSGPSDTDSASATVRDTAPPELQLEFLDQSGQPVSVTSTGTHVNASITATDTCDPDPLTSATATPVFEVIDGDTIKIQSGKINTVELPTTAIELSGTASDASGNTASGMSVLSIVD